MELFGEIAADDLAKGGLNEDARPCKSDLGSYKLNKVSIGDLRNTFLVLVCHDSAENMCSNTNPFPTEVMFRPISIALVVSDADVTFHLKSRSTATSSNYIRRVRIHRVVVVTERVRVFFP